MKVSFSVTKKLGTKHHFNGQPVSLSHSTSIPEEEKLLVSDRVFLMLAVLKTFPWSQYVVNSPFPWSERIKNHDGNATNYFDQDEGNPPPFLNIYKWFLRV